MRWHYMSDEEVETTPATEKPTEEVKEEVKEEKTLSPNERAEANINAMKAENDRMEKNILAQQELKATDMLSGSANAGQAPVKKEKLNDMAYAEAMERGEVDPFKEDGF